LNPVAVLINKAMIEIPPRFAGQPPVNPEARGKLDLKGGWRGAAGLADDVRYYGAWMRQQALQRIGHLYPQATLPDGRGHSHRLAVGAYCGKPQPSLSWLPGAAGLVILALDQTGQGSLGRAGGGGQELPLRGAYWQAT
jgi:putative DNA methylase